MRPGISRQYLPRMQETHNSSTLKAVLHIEATKKMTPILQMIFLVHIFNVESRLLQ